VPAPETGHDAAPAPRRPTSRKRINLLALEVTPLAVDDVVDVILAAVEGGAGLVVGNVNLHGAYLHHTDAVFREYSNRADLVLVDGIPIVWAAGPAAGLSSRHRVGSTDWFEQLMPRFSGRRVLAIGGSPSSSAGTARHVENTYPGVEWIAVDGFDGVASLASSVIESADLVLVGMGMPRQEAWILDHREELRHSVVANVGGLVDYYSGTQTLAPRWLGRFGLEWVFRLANNPRRLWKRYLIEPLQLVGVLARVHLSRAPAEDERGPAGRPGAALPTTPR